MTNEDIKSCVLQIIERYPIKSVLLFGSRAAETNRKDTDVDLIMEFDKPVSILTLSKIQYELEELLKVDIDLIHGPIRDDDMIEVGKVVELYAA